jgi:hypothetical protein
LRLFFTSFPILIASRTLGTSCWLARQSTPLLSRFAYIFLGLFLAPLSSAPLRQALHSFPFPHSPLETKEAMAQSYSSFPEGKLTDLATTAQESKVVISEKSEQSLKDLAFGSVSLFDVQRGVFTVYSFPLSILALLEMTLTVSFFWDDQLKL